MDQNTPLVFPLSPDATAACRKFRLSCTSSSGNRNKICAATTLLVATLAEAFVGCRGWMWGGGFTKESVIKERLYNLLGKEAYTNFLQQYYDNYITKKDIALIAQHGFNCIRLPFNYRIFEADNNQYIDGFKKLDEVISWCKKYGLYVIPDMHAAPGGQNNLFISDPENTKLWNSEENQKHANDLWRKIAERYNNDTTIAG